MAQAVIVCPLCKSELKEMVSGVSCVSCGKTFLVKDGTPCFGERSDLYEGRFTGTIDWDVTGTWALKIVKRIYRSLSIDGFEYQFLDRNIKNISSRNGYSTLRILDFGSGGGVKTLPKYGRVVGVDVSLLSLSEARKVYESVYQIDGEHLPFPEECFDVVYSSHVFGHIPPHQKNTIIKEMFKILKPGGYLISSIECDSESYVYRRAKKYPELFRKCYIDPWGHYGLELPEGNFKRFRQAGFVPIIEMADKHKGYLRPATSYALLRSFKEKDRFLYFWGVFSFLVSKSDSLTRMCNVLFGLLVPCVSFLTPPSHCDSVEVLYQKPL